MATNEQLMERLNSVEDPELRMSITELGLVYGVDQDDKGNSVVVRESGSGWSKVAGPWGQARAFATVGGRLYAVCRNGDSPVQVWSHAA